MVSSKLIQPGSEVVVEWNQTKPKPESKKKRETSAFEQLKVKAAKKAKTG